jgi:bacteriocin biosynthesis cyclodehydratase domain-containing protein
VTLKKPAWKGYFHVEIVEPDTVFLVSEATHRILTGRTMRLLAPLLNGQHTIAEIAGLLAGQVGLPEIYGTIQQLAAKGFVGEGTIALSAAEDAYWQSVNVEPAKAAAKLAQTVSLKVIGHADQSAEMVEAALALLGISLAETGALQIVLTDDYHQPELREVNREAIGSGQPWLLAKPVGGHIWLGPLFQPPNSACWECLAQRLEANRQVESYILRKNGRKTPLPTSIGALPATLSAAANMIATEAAKWLVNGRLDHLTNQLVSYQVLSAETTVHPVIRRPQCPACGSDDYAVNDVRQKPMVLQPCPKRHTSDGGHRTVRPEETYRRYEQQISPISGVVSMLTNIRADSRGMIYSYNASHNFAMISDDMHVLRRNLRARSGGKGTTEIQAKVSALSEAIERYSGVYRGEDEVRLRGSYRSLGEAAVHMQDCLLFSEKQYANRHEWNKASSSSLHLIPNPFDEEKEVDWSPLWSLTNQNVRYIPTVYCYYGHPDVRYFYCATDANGCAAGNTLEEAILQGFLELVERDATALWWYNCIGRPGVDVSSFNLPYFDQLKRYYQEYNRDLWVLDLTSDFNIPTFAALSARNDVPRQDIIIGLGCHLDARIGVLRALTEVNQMLPAVTFIGPDGKQRYQVNDQDTLDWLTKATTSNQPYLLPNPDLPAKRYEQYARLYTDDIKEDVEVCVALAAAAGLETLVLEQTRPDIGMAVCKVIVPGMRHFWRRLGPGRLYDVPLKEGWLQRPIAEADLNPFSIFF